MVTHSSILAWEVPWTKEPGGLQSMVLQRVWVKQTEQSSFTVIQLVLILIYFFLIK